MSDIIALEQSNERRWWHFINADTGQRYLFATRGFSDKELACFLVWPGDAIDDSDPPAILVNADALLLLQAFRRRCKLDPIPDRVFE